MSRTFITSDGVSADALQKNPNFLLDNYILEGKTIPIHLFGDNTATAIDDAITYLTNAGGGSVFVPANGTNFELEITVMKNRNATFSTKYTYHYDRHPTVEERPYSGGAWQVGDTIINNKPTVDNTSIGWVCVSGGTPGTWRALNPVSGTDLIFKGSLLYANLPISPENGDYYYCSDGNGTDGAGYYAWNGTTWNYIGDTGLADIVQTRGSSETKVMSQEAVTNELSIIEEKTDTILVKRGKKQLFDKHKYSVDDTVGIYCNSSNVYQDNARWCVLPIEVNASAGDTFSFNVISPNLSTLQGLLIYTSDEVPVAGNSCIEKGVTLLSNIRGSFLNPLTQAAKYLCIGYAVSGAEEAIALYDEFFNNLVLCSGLGNYNNETYYPYNIMSIEEENLSDEILEKLNNVGTDEVETVENELRAIQETTLYVGENLVTETTVVTFGDGWSGSVANGFTHTSGSDEPLALNVGTESGEAYIVEFDASSYAEKAMTIGIGDEPKVDPYNGRSHMVVGIVSDSGYLYITPSASYVGTLQNILVRKVVSSADEGTELVQIVYNVNHGQTTADLTGFWNIAIGSLATMSSNQNGTRDIAIGHYAMRALKSGHRNIAIGTLAMTNVTEGDRNIVIGADSLYGTFNLEKSVAYDNVAIGKAALRNGSLVQKNVAVGANAMSNSGDTANQNACVGFQAGYYAAVGNTHVGNRAGYYTKGNNNTSLGNGAGNTTYVTGDKCVCIGANSGVAADDASSSNIKTVNNVITLGSDAKATKSNQAVIGSDAITETLLKGDLIVRGTDGVYRQIVFNADHTVSWIAVE